MQQWIPLTADRLAERLPSDAGATSHVKLEPLSACLDSDASVSALRAAAKDIQRTGRHIGLLAFVVYAHIRRVRVHALIGLRSLDLLEHFAPALAGGCKELKPPLTVAFCRCMVFWEGGTPHRVVQVRTTDAVLAHRNHWVVAVPRERGPVYDGAKPHFPCLGRRCGQAALACPRCRSLY